MSWRSASVIASTGSASRGDKPPYTLLRRRWRTGLERNWCCVLSAGCVFDRIRRLQIDVGLQRIPHRAVGCPRQLDRALDGVSFDATGDVEVQPHRYPSPRMLGGALALELHGHCAKLL